MDGMTEEETREFLRGYYTASRNEPRDAIATPAWKDGYDFRLQVMAEKNELTLCKTLH